MLNTLAQISEAGVAVCLDDLSRERLKSGSLAKLIADPKMLGLVVTPTTLSSAINFANDPFFNRSRDKSSSHTATPASDICASVLSIRFFNTFLYSINNILNSKSILSKHNISASRGTKFFN